MDPIYKKALANKTSEIMKRISNPVVLSAHLKTIFSTADLEEIEAKTSQRGATTGTQTLLSLLEKRGPKAFALFIQALLDPAINNADLADDLEQEERKLRGIADSLVKDIPFALRTKIERMLNINTINDWRGLAAAMKLSIDDVDKVEEGENGKITGLFDKMILTKTTITDLLDFLRHPAVQRLDVIDEIVESYIFDLPKALSENESSELDKTADTAVMLPSYVNNRQVSDSLLLELVENLSTSWKMLGRRLDISNVALVNIDMEHDRVVEKAMAMFAEWKRRKGEGATVGVLRDALERTGRRDLSERVRVTSDPIVTVTQLQEISDDVGNCWSEVVPLLCIPELFISPVQKKYRMNKDRAMAILVKWKQREGHNATVGRLADVFEKVGRKDIAEILLREPRETPKIEAKNRDSYDEERDCGKNKLTGYSERGRSVRQETNKDISKEPSTSSGPGDSRGGLGSAVSGYSSISSKEVTSLHHESCPKAEDVLQMDKLGIVPEPIVKSAHEGESIEDPKDNISVDPVELPMSTVSRVTDIRAATMMFEARHGECIRVLPYIKDGQIVVQFYVYSGESGIPKDLKEEAQTFFEDMNVKLEWSDLYNNSVNILKVQRLEYLFGKPKTLTASQVEEMNDVIEKNLPILSKHRNVTSVQASFKIKNCTQKDEPCITIYVLGKGFIPFGELAFPNAFEGYPVDVVNGFWIRAGKEPKEAQTLSDVLCLGASIGVQGKEASGTLGAIVKDGSTYYALSCDHVMNSEESNCIVHPGLNDHLYYLNYYLKDYKRCVDDVTGLEIECSVETLSSREALGNKFEELKRIKDNHPESSKYTSADLERIEDLEKKFEKGNKPPRKIGEYFVGVNKNVLWPQTNGKEYFIDAAIAKLSDEEVTRLKQSRTARLIGEPTKIRGECEPNHIPAISETSKLCKSGRTTGITEIGNKIVGIGVVAPHFMKPSLYELHDPFVSCEAKTFVCESCGESQSIVAESEQPRSCEECGQGKAAMDGTFWLKRCLCIQEGEEEFANSGDSGSVIFVKVKKDDPEKNAECDPEKKAECDRKKKAEYVLDGVGLLFGIQNHQYCRYIFASPLKIALAALTEEHRDISSLALVASYQ